MQRDQKLSEHTKFNFHYMQAQQAIMQVKGAAQGYGYSGGRNHVVATALRNTSQALEHLLNIVSELQKGQRGQG